MCLLVTVLAITALMIAIINTSDINDLFAFKSLSGAIGVVAVLIFALNFGLLYWLGGRSTKELKPFLTKAVFASIFGLLSVGLGTLAILSDWPESEGGTRTGSIFVEVVLFLSAAVFAAAIANIFWTKPPAPKGNRDESGSTVVVTVSPSPGKNNKN